MSDQDIFNCVQEIQSTLTINVCGLLASIGGSDPFTTDNLTALARYLDGQLSKIFVFPANWSKQICSDELKGAKGALKCSLSNTADGRAVCGFIPAWLLWLVVDCIVSIVLKYWLSTGNILVVD
jgi:hypothetical protein